MSLVYNSTLLAELEFGRKQMRDVKCVMIQSTGIEDEDPDIFYNDIKTKLYKQYAHYVAGASHTVQYAYLDGIVFPDSIKFTNTAKTLLCNLNDSSDSPAYHIVAFELCTSYSSYGAIELSAIKFLAQFLYKNNLTTDNVWRRTDIIDEVINTNPQYSTNTNWAKFIAALNLALDELKKANPNMESLTGSGVSYTGAVNVFELDNRFANLSSLVLRKADIKSVSESDYTPAVIAGVVTQTDKFKNTVTISDDLQVEPIYPDLTVPPRSTTHLYNIRLRNIKDVKTQVKPVLGRQVNSQTPYPVDTKITELEQHYPIVKLDDNALSVMNSNSVTAAYLYNLSVRTEKRLCQLENTLATMTRYLFRLSSRMNVNCVYYGGQSSADKYNCIRCLKDDLVSDGAIVALDQCLNCSRYEPIIGQVYDILSENMELNAAPILDDIQAARMTKEDYIRMSRVEEMVDSEEEAYCDPDELTKKNASDKTLIELAEKNSNFVMDWAETSLPQTPDINEYKYDPATILKDKKSRILPINKYVDGYADVKKKKIDPIVNEYGIIAGTDEETPSVQAAAGFWTINDFDWSNATMLKKVVDTTIELAELGKKGKAGYVYGGKVKPDYEKKSPSDLLKALQLGTQPCVKNDTTTPNNPIRTDAISLDCSGFAHYVYAYAGAKVVYDGATAIFNQNCEKVATAKDYEANIAAAQPGDLVFYSSDNGNTMFHVTVYIGNGEHCHASGFEGKTIYEQVKRAKVHKENFYCIARVKGVARPKLKNIRTYNVDLTIEQAAQKQLSSSTGAGGGDHDAVTVNEIIQYLNPNNYMQTKEKYQFFNLGKPNGLSVEQVKAILKSHGATQVLIDNADAYLEAARLHNISEAYLIAHSGLESGWGSSNLASGKRTGPKTGQVVYNLYGIAAYNSDSSRNSALSYAEDNKWFSVRAAIIGGAKFVAEDYIAKGQNTLYKMRWNFPKCSHQYATDVAWAVKQCNTISKVLDAADASIKEKYLFDIPVFKTN